MTEDMQYDMKLKTIFIFWGLVWLFIFFSPQIQAQFSNRAKAEKLFDELQYAKAVAVYQKLTDTANPELEDMEHLAECYKKMNQYEDAEIWYARIANDPRCKPEILFSFGEILKTNARYSEAKKVLDEYFAMTNDQSVFVSIAGCDSAIVWMSSPTDHVIRNEQSINTTLSEFSVFPIGINEVSFVGEPKTSDNRNKYGWTGSSYLRIFTAERLNDNSLKSRMLSKSDYNNASYHVGPISTNKAGTISFITRTYPGNKGSLTKVNGNTYYTQKMELYIISKIYGQWQKPESFAYNNVQKYSVGHAVLSNDEKILYFVSDMPGGKGGTDIWYSELQENGTWGRPRNAGSVINTSRDEMFPTVGPDSMLYYSSKGLPGMGGLDIFCSKGYNDQWSKPVNMRYPINSPCDDFSYMPVGGQGRGYFSSNRINGEGGDDIYSYNNEKPTLNILGIVYNKKTGMRLPNAEVTLYGSSHEIIARQVSKPDGSFAFSMNKMDWYNLKSTKDGFYPDTLSLNPKDFALSNTRKVILSLDPLFEKGKTFKLENIHYNFDKDQIRLDASLILNDLVKIMHENPTLKIELASHTDSRGTDKYNLDLSQRRAQSAVDYLVIRGISRSRMEAKGYGETRLLNRCENDVPCSEAEHQKNRRTEFTIISY